MKLKVDLFADPPPLVIGSGADQFEVLLTKPTDLDKLAAIDAISRRSYEAVGRAARNFIKDFRGIHDCEGKDIPAEGIGPNDEKFTRADAVLAALEPGALLAIQTAILAFIGVPENILEDFRRDAKVMGVAVDPNPTPPPGGATASAASGG